jgi:hypothetical protein
MTRDELAKRLRWLADQWQRANPALRQRIERAFRNGYERGLRTP